MTKWIIETKQTFDGDWEFVAEHERAFTSGFSLIIGQGEACEIAEEWVKDTRPVAVRVAPENAGPDEWIYSRDGQTWVDAKQFTIPQA